MKVAVFSARNFHYQFLTKSMKLDAKVLDQ